MFALIIAHNKVIESVGSRLQMVKLQIHYQKLFDKSWRYWNVVELNAKQLEVYNNRKPGELVYYD